MVFRFELRRQLPNTLIWTALVAGMLWLMMYGFYPIFLSSRPAMEEILASMPPQVMIALGLDADKLFGFQNFSSVVYIYEGILTSIMASGTAISVFAREKQSKCSDFLFTKPESRLKIFVQKLLCCLTLISILNIPYIMLFLTGYFHYTGANAVSSATLLSALCPFFTQLVFTSIALFTALFLRRIRSASGLGVGIGIFAFLMSMVYSLTEKPIFRFVSPLYYFSPVTVSETGGYDTAGVITAVILIAGLTSAACAKYTREDITV